MHNKYVQWQKCATVLLYASTASLCFVEGDPPPPFSKLHLKYSPSHDIELESMWLCQSTHALHAEGPGFSL